MPTLLRRIGVVLIYIFTLSILPILLISTLPNNESGMILSSSLFVELIIVLGFVTYLGFNGRLIGSRKPLEMRTTPKGFIFRFKNLVALISAVVIVPTTLIFTLNTVIIVLGLILKYIEQYLYGESIYLITFFRIVLGYLAFVYGGIPVARLLLRIAPPRPNGSIRWIAIMFSVAVAYMALGIGMRSSVFVSHHTFSIAFCVALGILAPVLLRQLKPSSFLDLPYVLMLRRFSSFSDRIVSGSVLSSKMCEKQIVLLTPTYSKTADWNPILISFSGLSLFSPIRSVPIFLRETDESWNKAVELYIEKASRIVLDASVHTDAIEHEVNMLKSMNRWKDTLVLAKDSALDAQLKRYNIPAEVTAIGYKKSWWFMIPRVMFGFVLINIGASSLSLVRRMFEQMLYQLNNSNLDAISLATALILLAAPIFLFNFSILIALLVTFVGPSVSWKSSRLIKKWGESLISIKSQPIYNRKLLLTCLLIYFVWNIDDMVQYSSSENYFIMFLILASSVSFFRDSVIWFSRFLSLLILNLVTLVPKFYYIVGGMYGEITYFYLPEFTLWLIELSFLIFMLVSLNIKFKFSTKAFKRLWCSADNLIT